MNPFHRVWWGPGIGRNPGSWEISFALVAEVKGLGGCGACSRESVGRSADVSEIQQDVCGLAQ